VLRFALETAASFYAEGGEKCGPSRSGSVTNACSRAGARCHRGQRGMRQYLTGSCRFLWSWCSDAYTNLFKVLRFLAFCDYAMAEKRFAIVSLFPFLAILVDPDGRHFASAQFVPTTSFVIS
jgi:hypothetical protein